MIRTRVTLKIAASLALAALYPLAAQALPASDAQAVQLSAAGVVGPGNADGSATELDIQSGGYPFVVPLGQVLCITHVALTNKYPFNPLRYANGNMATLMFETGVGIRVSAHDPQMTFYPGFEVGAGQKVVAYAENAMSEPQRVMLLVQGFLVPSNETCFY